MCVCVSCTDLDWDTHTHTPPETLRQHPSHSAQTHTHTYIVTDTVYRDTTYICTDSQSHRCTCRYTYTCVYTCTDTHAQRHTHTGLSGGLPWPCPGLALPGVPSRRKAGSPCPRQNGWNRFWGFPSPDGMLSCAHQAMAGSQRCLLTSISTHCGHTPDSRSVGRPCRPVVLANTGGDGASEEEFLPDCLSFQATFEYQSLQL